jgi:hypothetical protein
MFQSSVFPHLLCSLQVIIKAFTKTTGKTAHNLNRRLERAHLRIVTGEVVRSWCHNHCTRVNVRDISIYYLLVTFVPFTDKRVSIPTIVSYIHIHIVIWGYCLCSLCVKHLQRRCDYTDNIIYWPGKSNIVETKYFWNLVLWFQSIFKCLYNDLCQCFLVIICHDYDYVGSAASVNVYDLWPWVYIIFYFIRDSMICGIVVCANRLPVLH